MSIKIIKPAVLEQFALGDPIFFQGTVDNGVDTVKLFAEQYLLNTIAVNDGDRKSTRLNSSHVSQSRMPSSA